MKEGKHVQKNVEITLNSSNCLNIPHYVFLVSWKNNFSVPICLLLLQNVCDHRPISYFNVGADLVSDLQIVWSWQFCYLILHRLIDQMSEDEMDRVASMVEVLVRVRTLITIQYDGHGLNVIGRIGGAKGVDVSD